MREGEVVRGQGRLDQEAENMTKNLQTQLSGRFLLVMRRILPAARAIGIAQQTMRGVVRPLLLMVVKE